LLGASIRHSKAQTLFHEDFAILFQQVTFKKWATRHGHAGKLDMIRESMKYLGRPPEDDNEADAVLLGMYAHAEFRNGGE
jgi:hypothetical protein